MHNYSLNSQIPYQSPCWHMVWSISITNLYSCTYNAPVVNTCPNLVVEMLQDYWRCCKITRLYSQSVRTCGLCDMCCAISTHEEETRIGNLSILFERVAEHAARRTTRLQKIKIVRCDQGHGFIYGWRQELIPIELFLTPPPNNLDSIAPPPPSFTLPSNPERCCLWVLVYCLMGKAYCCCGCFLISFTD